MAKKTTTEYLEELYHKRGNPVLNLYGLPYEYTITNYINNSTDIHFICPNHGKIKQHPGLHKRGGHCLQCRLDIQREENRIKFLANAQRVHGDRYDYSLVEYVNNATDVIIVCREHGEFPQRPNNHIDGQAGCPICANEDRKNTNLANFGSIFPIQNKRVLETRVKNNREKYDCDYPQQTKEHQTRLKEIFIENFGVDNPLKSPVVREQIKQTCVERLGVDNPRKSNVVIDKIKRTQMKNYGMVYLLEKNEVCKHISNTFNVNISSIIDFNFLDVGVQTDIIEFCISKYGHINANHVIYKQGIDKLQQYDWLYVEFVDNNKKIDTIAQELSVRPSAVTNHLIFHKLLPAPERKYIGSNKSIEWLTLIEYRECIIIEHERNVGEFQIPGTRYRADGYCRATNTIYEFHGDYWHGNPDKFAADDYNYSTYCTMGELYDITIKREQTIRNLGYNLVVMWESEFDRINN